MLLSDVTVKDGRIVAKTRDMNYDSLQRELQSWRSFANDPKSAIRQKHVNKLESYVRKIDELREKIKQLEAEATQYINNDSNFDY